MILILIKIIDWKNLNKANLIKYELFILVHQFNEILMKNEKCACSALTSICLCAPDQY